MHKIYSRPRIKIPKISLNRGSKGYNPKLIKVIEILSILFIAFSTVKLILDAVLPIFDTICQTRAQSIATIISNEQATKVMNNYSYEDLFTVEKDSNENITMINSNMIVINQIISDVAVNIQNEIDKRGREDIEIALR